MVTEKASILKSKADVGHTTAMAYYDWINQNEETVQTRKSALRREVLRTAQTLSRLSRAADRRMCVGVYGQSQSGKSFLISSLASKNPGTLKVRFGSEVKDFLNDINPTGGSESTGVVTRFQLQRDAIKDQNFPVEIRLMSEFDLVKVFGNTYHSDLAPELRHRPNETELDTHLGALEANLPTVSSDKTFELEDYFQDHFPRRDFPYFETLKPYWPRLSSIIENGSVRDRTQAYAVLWGLDDVFSESFERLLNLIDALGYAQTAYCKTEIFEQSSIMEVRTVEKFGQGTGTTTEILTPDNKRVSMDHAEVAALISELVVVLEDKPHDFFEHTDLLDFPGTRSRKDKGSLSKSVMGDLIVRGKVAFLFQRYAEERELTAMLLCVDDGPQEVVSLGPQVSNWIENTHGRTSKDRAGSAVSMFLVLTKVDIHFDKAPDTGRLDEVWTNRIHSSLENHRIIEDTDDGEKRDRSWLGDWANGKCFVNSYWLRNPTIETATFIKETVDGEGVETAINPRFAERLDRLKQGFVDNDEAARYFENPQEAWDAALELNDGGISYIVKNLIPTCNPELKEKQVERQLNERVTQLDEMLREFYVDSDLEKRVTQRRKAAQLFVRELKSCVDAQRFGHFLSCLYLDSDRTETVLKSIEHNVSDEVVVEADAEDDGWGELLDEIDDAPQDESPSVKTRDQVISEKLVEHWVDALSDTANSDQLSLFFLMSKESLDTVQRELVDGAKRIDLEGKIALQSKETSLFPWKFEEIVHHKSRLVTNIVNQFVNYLDIGQNGTAKDGSTAFQREKLAFDAQPLLPELPVYREKKYSLDWAKGFLEFVERNARSESGTENVNADANRVLEKLIKSMDSSETTS